MKPQKRGLPKNRIVPEQKMYFRPEVTHCPDCGTKLKRHHNASNKIIATLEGIIEVWNMAYHCPAPVCGKPKRYFRSVQADALCLKHTSYAYDVLALVGEMRFKQHMTVTEISEALTERGIPTSERHAMRLYEWYMTLLRASLTTDVKEQLANVVKEYNGLLLSMDGVQPEKGNETLYVVREGFSGRILAAKNLKSGSKTELMALLKPVKDLGFPVIGLVSDGQQSIRLAMGETWPETPYQYCQYHYLKDIAKPVVDLDRKLKTGLKKSLRGLREIEKQVEDDDSIESEVTRDYLAATRSLLLEDGNPPLDLPGIQIYEKAEAVKASLEKSVAKKGGAVLLKKVLLLFRKLPEFTSKYHEVKRWQIPIQETARLLAPAAVTEDQRSETVRFSMQCLLFWMQKTYTQKEDTVLVSNFQSYTRGFWKGLFTCYDSPWVPRTNNDHERFFRQTKTKHRRTTGRRSWNEHILRCGEFVVLVDDALNQEHLVSRLQQVSYEAFNQERCRWTKRLDETTKRRRFRRDPLAYLKQIENKLC